MNSCNASTILTVLISTVAAVIGISLIINSYNMSTKMSISADASVMNSSLMLLATAVIVIVGLLINWPQRTFECYNGIAQFSTPPILRKKQVMVANTYEEFSVAIQMILKECKEDRYIGFDCEWRPQTFLGQQPRPALLQLASPQGSCALLRLCKLGFIPDQVKAVLRDPNLLKIGVAPSDDARLLFTNYGAPVEGCIDLRRLIRAVNNTGPTYSVLDNLVEKNGYHGLGLAKLAQKILGVTLDKEFSIRCSDWEAETLSSRQIEYAANDALVAALIFAKIMRIVN